MGLLLKNNWKRLVMIALFYLINFVLWELIAPIITNEWASFAVYVVLFLVVILLFFKELKEEGINLWKKQLKDKKFYIWLFIALTLDLVLTVAGLWLANNVFPAILPQNNENVKEQMASVPLVLTIIQGCIFAPVIEEMTFRYAIIGKTESKTFLVISTFLAIVLFDCIHIVAVPEFFYYIVPSVILTLFYVKNRNVFASMILHSLINIVGYIALLFGAL